MTEGLCSACKEHLPINFPQKIMRPPSLISNHDDQKFNVLLR